ncbi:DUF4843 domain-containing protein [Niastella sp. OAS944]|uniref:DUF4843 domain-containing protein n=1 Tax=Niastella sp. OAS944 TaxID=2664089 RepID=UPI003474CA1D|nr:hypothetical protein [Chitinophagaceae bacterium OAS944]
MKKIIYYLYIAASALVLYSCEKNIPGYSGESNIYFSNTADSSKITFAYDMTGKKDSIIQVKVLSSGPVASVDREFKVKFFKYDTFLMARPDTDFVLPDNNFVIKAGQVSALLTFKLLRTPEMLKKTFYINMLLEPNENFNTNYSWDWVNLTNKTTRQVLMYTIRFDDVLAQPKAWITGSLGTFSRKKIYALCAFFDLELPIWNITGAGGIAAGTMINYGKIFQRYLNDERDNGNVILDEDGSPMVMGPNSQ